MEQKTTHKGIVLLGKSVTEEEAQALREAGFTVERVDSFDYVAAAPANGDLLLKYQVMAERSRDIMLFVRRDGRIIEANAAAIATYGYTREELLSLSIFDLRAPDAVQQTEEQMAAADTAGVLFETEHQRKDGSILAVEVSSQGTDLGGERVLLSIIRDITERRRAEEAAKENEARLRGEQHEREITTDLLHIINRGADTLELVRSAVTFFLQRSGCEAVGIRLKRGDDYPYWEARGFPEEFLEVENSLCIPDGEGGVLRDSAGYPILECMCGNIIMGRFDPSKPFFTEHGSFWTNCTTELLATTTEADRQARTRNRCNGEGYESVALIPLHVGEEGFGLIQLNDKRPGMFSPQLIALWERLADQLAIALDRSEAEGALRKSEAQLWTIIENVTEGLVVSNLDGQLFHWNSAALKMHGLTSLEECRRKLPELADTFVLSTMDGEVVPVENWPLARILRGENLRDLEIRVRRLDSEEEKVFSYSGTLVRDPDGQPLLGVVAVSDITNRKWAERDLAVARAEAEHRSAVLESVFSSLADGLAVLDGSWNITMMNEAGRRIFGVESDEEMKDWPTHFPRYGADDRPLPPETTASGRALRGEVVHDTPYQARRADGKLITISVSAAPIRDREGHITGATNTFRDITERTVVERQRDELLTREHHIAEMLQSAIVPTDVPSRINDYRFAARYVPALREAEVGGDFYDIFDLGDGKVGVLIGDVTGKGLAAAIRVAAARHALRAYAYLDPRPARVMTMTNDALCRDGREEPGMLTAFFAVLDTEGGTMVYTSAGHEPPIIDSADGTCEELALGGMAIGLASGITYSQTTRRMDYGDLVVMVTDGITEARAPGPDLFGKDRLIQFVRDHRNTTPDEIADAILAEATLHAGGRLQDDAAIVAFSVGPGSGREQSK